jgi:hypothetical protein
MQKEEYAKTTGTTSLQPFLMYAVGNRNDKQLSLENAQKFLDKNGISYARVQGILLHNVNSNNQETVNNDGEFDVENMTLFRYFYNGIWKENTQNPFPKTVTGQIRDVLVIFDSDGTKIVVDWNFRKLSSVQLGFANLFIPVFY